MSVSGDREPLLYGYCRVSTPSQNIERQERNILRKYPTAICYREVLYRHGRVLKKKRVEQAAAESRVWRHDHLRLGFQNEP